MKDEVLLRNSINRELDELFDKFLRPLRSKNARGIFLIFLERRDVPYLTTFDLQNRLHQDGVELTKVELNNWLKSLNDAEIITKGERRGKPTTIDYDDRYTFDMWSLTSKGLQIATDLNRLMTGSLTLSKEDESVPAIREIGVYEETSMTDLEIEVSSLQTIMLSILHGEVGPITKASIKQGFTPPDDLIEEALSNLIFQGAVQEEEASDLEGLLTKILRVIGLTPERDVVYRLTEKGRKMASGDSV